MNFVIFYLSQDKIDLAEKLLGRKTTWQERNKMGSWVISTDAVAAERLVEHFRLTGHLSYLEETSEV
jgi:hypothetical protein